MITKYKQQNMSLYEVEIFFVGILVEVLPELLVRENWIPLLHILLMESYKQVVNHKLYLITGDVKS